MAQRYRVSGTRKVFGHAPGTVFDRDIPVEQEATLLASGAIERESEAGGAELPEGVVETSPGWFELPDGAKVHGRKALDEALKEADATAPADTEPGADGAGHTDPQTEE